MMVVTNVWLLLTLATSRVIASYVCTELANHWPSYIGKRVDEGSKYDCPKTSPGGQCVALLKVKCGLPWTGYWHADEKLTDVCGRLKLGTALATFDSKYSPYKNRDGPVIYDHAAVYLGCDSNGITVLEQSCQFAIRKHTYSRGHDYFHRFYSIK